MFPWHDHTPSPTGIQVPSVSFCCHKVEQDQDTRIGERKQKLEHHLLLL